MTIKDIAKACGVSVSTVSRVLNNRPDVSPAVRQKVLEVVDAYNYIPNNSARDLVKSTSDAIGLIVRGVSNPFFMEMIKTIEQEIDKAGYTMVMQQINSGDDEIKCGAILEREKKLNGIIFLGGSMNYSTAEIALLNVPFVCCSYNNHFGNLPDEVYSSVTIDDDEAAYQAVMELINRGHRRIAALVSSTHDRSISELRYMGYTRALKECNIPLDESLVEETGSFNMPEAYAGMKRLISRSNDFTAVFTIADVMAIAAMKALDEMGKPVPEQCSVIAIDGIQLSEYVLPTLTTLEQPLVDMGTESVRILINMVENREGNCHVKLDAKLREGASVRDML